MIQGFSDYETTEVKEFTPSEKITLGGHICKILGVETETVTSKKDGSVYNILKLKYDLDDDDEQAGFYQKKFVEDANRNALDAKWKGYHRLTIPNNSSADFAKQNWKGFLTSVEESNAGVKLNGTTGFDENILIGKKFGGIFGLEEFTLPTNGKTITFSKLRFTRSINKIKEVPIPSVKLLDGTYVKYDEYIAKQSGESVQSSNTTGMFSDTDDLPF